jgi:hypothetical protein
MDAAFEQLGSRYIDEIAALSPVSATWLGDHRFDDRLDDVGREALERQAAFCRTYLGRIERIPKSRLSRAHQIDGAMLIVLKWYLRGIANAIIDQAVHAEDMTEDAAMRLMMDGTFQEEREAAGKWVRAQLTSAQLSTYFVGYLEHASLRRDVETMAHRILWLLAGVVLAGAAANVLAAEFYVSPSGTPGGDGSKARPWNLATALAHPAAVKPGDTIWLLGGTYVGAFDSRLKGTAAAPITVRQAPGERATIDGGSGKSTLFSVGGEWTRYWGFEVTCSNPQRETRNTGSAPADVNRGGVNCQGSNISFINLAVHDGSCGFGFWSNGEGGEIYGCIIYNNGWEAPDRGHGHAIYTQNKTGTKRLVDNVMFNQFCYGIHAYGSSRAFLVGFRVEGNVSFNNGAAKSPTSLAPAILVGGGSPSERIEVIENYTYSTGYGGAALQLGYGAANKDAVVKDNYFVGGVSLRKWEKLTVAGNTFIGGPPQVEPSAGDWRASNTVVAGRPTGVKVVVRPNAYEPGRVNVVVYNWDKKDAVEADLSKVLKAGARFKIVSAQDFFGEPVLDGRYDGKPVRLPMKEYRAVPPIGKEKYVPPATGPEFNVFVVLPGE